MTEKPTASAQVNAVLDFPSISLSVDSLGQLCVNDSKGAEYINVTPVRLFPLSRPQHWVTILDTYNRELVCIADLAELSPENQAILSRELERREFVPVVKRVFSVSGNSEPCEWDVETDRGRTKFVLKSEYDVRRLGEHSVLIVDSFGIRYFIPDRNELDKYSRRVIEWYV